MQNIPAALRRRKRSWKRKDIRLSKKEERISDTMLKTMKMPCLRYRRFREKENKR